GDIQAFQEVMANEESYTNFLTKYFEPWKDRMLQAVPHYMALAFYNKAMAITETYIYSSSNDTSYGQVDYSSIFSQEKYSGLVKISEEEEEQERVPAVGAVRLHPSVVHATTVNEGDLVVSGRIAYAAL